jgi:crotonobetainyl-CoA:carnitine CoA-transferase CaiB-like acyl-CoA transferase
VNILFEQENRGKRAIVIGLDQPGGIELLYDVLKTADVLLTNLIEPRLRRYRLLPADLRQVNPTLIHASLTGYGIRGPEAARPAFDFAAFWARSGIMSVVGHPGAPPVLSRVAQGDHTTGVFAVTAILAALRLRDQTGEGQVVEVSLQQAGAFTIATDLVRALQERKQPPKMDRTAPGNPLFNTYRAADGQWIMLVHMTPDPYWEPFCSAIEMPEWATDERFSSMARRAGFGAFLADAIQQRIGSAPFAHWNAVFDAHGLIWAPAVQLPDVVDDRQLRTLGAFPSVAHSAGAFELVGPPFSIWDADVGIRACSPQVGEHTADILAEAGIDAERIAELAAAGVFG